MFYNCDSCLFDIKGTNSKINPQSLQSADGSADDCQTGHRSNQSAFESESEFL